MRPDGLLEWLDDKFIQAQFGPGARIEFYEELSILLENRVLLNEGLKEMYAIASKEGRNPRVARAVVIHECMQAVGEGKPLSHALQRWASYQEISLIAAGERAGGDLKTAFDDAIKIITAKQEILAAAMSATIYPSILIMLTCVLLKQISTQLIPKLAKTTNPQTWEGSAQVLYQISQFVTNYGLAALAVMIMTVVLIFASMPYLRGSVRIYLDKLPPWSIYRMLHGATFLLNVAVMIRAGIKLHDALTLLAANANPWLRERIETAIYGTGIGGNLGVALYNAGFQFPDKRAVEFLMILASREGFDEAIGRFGDRWLIKSIKRVQRFAKVALGCGVLFVGILMLLIVSGMGEIQNAIQATRS